MFIYKCYSFKKKKKTRKASIKLNIFPPTSMRILKNAMKITADDDCHFRWFIISTRRNWIANRKKYTRMRRKYIALNAINLLISNVRISFVFLFCYIFLSTPFNHSSIRPSSHSFMHSSFVSISLGAITKYISTNESPIHHRVHQTDYQLNVWRGQDLRRKM